MLARALGLGLLAAHEHVARRIAELGPGVHRDVRLGEEAERGDALMIEAVRDLVQERGASAPRRFADRFDDDVLVVQPLLRTPVQLEDAV